MKTINGHELLIQDLKGVMSLAENKEFHDFENTLFATPKMESARQLTQIVENAKEGKYDDKP